MTENEKVYHIYAKGQCIYHSLTEEKFSEIWETIHRMIDLLEVKVTKDELDYEELLYNKHISLNSSY